MPIKINVEIPGNVQKLKELYAWVSCDENGNEGVLAFSDEDRKLHTPLVGGNLATLKAYTNYVRMIAKGTGYKMRLKAYKYPEVLVEIDAK